VCEFDSFDTAKSKTHTDTLSLIVLLFLINRQTTLRSLYGDSCH